MSDELREALSALMDGEASEEDIDRVLDQLDRDDVRDAWSRYQLAGQSLAAGAAEQRFDIDVSRRVGAMLSEEPAFAVETAAVETAAVETAAVETAAVETAAVATTAADAIQPVGRWHRFTGPVTSFAVAASVCAAVLLGAQYFGSAGGGAEGGTGIPAIAERATGGVVSTLGGAANRANFSSPGVGPAAPVSDYDALARERLKRYILPHTEEAVLNGPRGMMPFARVASFETEE